MSRRSGNAALGGDSSTDIMTSLIGCLILILIGVLIIILVAQTLVVVTEPREHEIKALVTSDVEGVPDEKSFPQGNRKKQPIYVDVHEDYLLLLDGGKRMGAASLSKKDGEFQTFFDALAEKRNEEYLVLLVRPRAAAFMRKLRHEIAKRDLEVGFDLVPSDWEFPLMDEEGKPIPKEKTASKATAEEPAEEKPANETETPPAQATPVVVEEASAQKKTEAAIEAPVQEKQNDSTEEIPEPQQQEEVIDLNEIPEEALRMQKPAINNKESALGTP